MKLIKKELFFKQISVDEENFTIRGVFSTGTEDRHAEVVDQKGWKLEEYKQNPVVLFAHDHYQPAIGQCVELGINADGNLEGTIKFAAAEYEFAKTIFNLYKGGFMRAFSVGFMNDVYEVDQENDRVILKENTLFEISCVNVPANSLALALSKGVNVGEFEKVLTGKEKIRKQKTANYLLDGETKEQFITRKVPELMESGLTEEKAVAEAARLIEAPDQKSIEVSKLNHETIRAAIGTLQEILKAAPEPDNQAGQKGRIPLDEKGRKKEISYKVLNRAIRQLIKAKSIVK